MVSPFAISQLDSFRYLVRSHIACTFARSRSLVFHIYTETFAWMPHDSVYVSPKIEAEKKNSNNIELNKK